MVINQDARRTLANLEAAYRDLDPSMLTDDDTIQLVNERIEALRMAISALQAQDVPDTNVGDMVSRRAAIDALVKLTNSIDAASLHRYVKHHNLGVLWSGGVSDALEVIEKLPPAQPERRAQDVPDANVGDTISEANVIDTEGLDEQIRCEMCRNPMHTSRGCDGNCKYDVNLYKRIMQILGERIKPLPSAQPEQRWIPVAERPPKKGQKCFVSDKGRIAIDTF